MRAFVLALAAGALVAGAACGPTATGHDCTECGDDRCVDIQNDRYHCGGCGYACPVGLVCAAGVCGADGTQACDQPGAVEDCYTGPAGTAGVGLCRPGTRTCLDSGTWSVCSGEIRPSPEICGNGIDEDCDGEIDNEVDRDGDGWTNCGGDCCDSVNEGCAHPERVNPGAFEVDGNGVDDDCDGIVDNATTALCDSGLASNSNDPLDYARAMELCQTASEADRRWGVISARFARADGSGEPLAVQRAIRPGFGATAVQQGSSMVVLSTAHAATPGQQSPAFSSWESTSHGTSSLYPQDWYAANNNRLPNAPGCPNPVGNRAMDPVMLELRVRAPTNAQSFSMRVNFMSAEFPEFTCTQYNDFFVVLLDSAWAGNPANPADKNLAFYVNPQNQIYPVGVNLAHGNTGLFQVCRNGPTGCAGFPPVTGNITTCVSDAELAGTGMDAAANALGRCSGGDQVGGGTGWLTTSGNVVGGEIFTLRIALWDTSDGNYDSVALIDAFEWSINPSDPGTVIDVD
jgi:hypothetical protein